MTWKVAILQLSRIVNCCLFYNDLSARPKKDLIQIRNIKCVLLIIDNELQVGIDKEKVTWGNFVLGTPQEYNRK